MKKVPVLILAALWAALVLSAWFSPAKEISTAERRPLAQMPQFTLASLADGKFMTDFEDYTLDQFPLRDSFRQIKALFSRNLLAQKDNNGIYVSQGHIAELCYPLDEDSVAHALKQIQMVYDLYLADSDCKLYATMVPDKSYYLADTSNHLAMDHEAMMQMIRDGMPWATFTDITGALTLEDYYYTDTHWRQERILPVANLLAQAMGVSVPEDSFTPVALDRPFYGVYYGQAALPMEAETMYIMESDLLTQCQVYNYVTDSYAPVYDLQRLTANDPYEVFLSGSQSMLLIENPSATGDRHLVVFRDSFGSSLVPLLSADYATVTLLDIRYIHPQLLGKYVQFTNQDVLFMYSSLVLNKNLI